MKNNKSDQPVTRSEFQREARGTRKEFGVVRKEMRDGFQVVRKEFEDVRKEMRDGFQAVRKEMNGKIDRLALDQVSMREEIRQVKETMATKDDVRRILGAIDEFARKSEVFERKALVY